MIYNWAQQYLITEGPSNISMHCNIMICAYDNVLTHYDFIMDISSNIFTYCNVIMGHETKKQCPLHDSHIKQCSEQNLRLWRFCSKQAIVRHNTSHLSRLCLISFMLIEYNIALPNNKTGPSITSAHTKFSFFLFVFLACQLTLHSFLLPLDPFLYLSPYHLYALHLGPNVTSGYTQSS